MANPSRRSLKITILLYLTCFLLPVAASAIASAETIKVGVYSNKPLVFQEENGEYHGLAIDILRHIANQENWDLQFVPGTWPECLNRLEQGSIDIQVAIAISSKRKKIFNYPEQTLITNWGRLYRAPGTTAESLLDLEGKKVAFLKRDIHAEVFFNLMAKFNKTTIPVPLQSYDAVLEATEKHKVDVGIVNRMYAMQNAHRYQVEATPMIFNPIEVRYATPKNKDTHLLPIIDKYLTDLRADKNSIYYQSLEKWFGQNEKRNLPAWIQPTLLVIGCLFILVIIHSLFMKRQVAARTTELNKSNARLTTQVHQLQQAEAALAKSEKRFKTFFNNTNDAIFVHQVRKKGFSLFVEINKMACQRYGYTKEEFMHLSPSDIWLTNSEDEKRIFSHHKQLLKTGWQIFEATHIDKSGTPFPVEINASVIDAKEDQPLILSVVRDISERIHAEKEKEKMAHQLNSAKRMESIGLMAGGVAHDLNNILSGIIGYPELLLQKLPKDSELNAPLKAIRESGRRAATVVADLLTVARNAASVKEPYNINTLIEEYLDSPECKKIQERHPDVTCREELTAKKAIILCSPVHVKKCLMNLLINASEAIPGSGTISISTHNRHILPAKAENGLIENQEYAVIKVCDTGPGISAKDIDHIFEPFYTKKVMGKSGTGLGLTVVWNTMEAHNGKVTVSSTERGTCFQLFFPLTMKSISPSDDLSVPETLRGNGEHILIVDDEPELRDIARQMLQSFGYSTDAVSSGEEAVEFIKQNPTDLLIIDMLMDPGINGRETYEKILEISPEQKAVIASGFSENTDVREVLRIGAKAFLKKPYSMQQLGEAVKKALNS